MKPRRMLVARSVPQVEKRKLRSQGEPDQVTLPDNKRARGKSKSPPSREGVKAVVLKLALAKSIHYDRFW
jgi:hypothetical protein